jgi:hypothetical protein
MKTTSIFVIFDNFKVGEIAEQKRIVGQKEQIIKEH